MVLKSTQILKLCRCWGAQEGITAHVRFPPLHSNLIFRRPQYDDSATAVIITKQDKADKYEKMMAGEEVLESRLVRQCLRLGFSIDRPLAFI